MPKAILDKLPDKARDIYEAAWQRAKEDGRDDETAAKIAIAAVERAGYAKDEETGQWHKMRYLSMHITKAALGGDGVMRWAATVSKFELDDQLDEVTPEFFKYAIAQVESGKRPAPVVCVSHIDKGKPDDSWVAGDALELYIDGDLPKAKGVFRDTPLGKAAFESVRADYGKPNDEKVRVSLGFYDESSVPLKITFNDGSEATGRRFKAGWIKHLALTRVPVVKETEITVMEAKAMAKTKQEDAASIVGAELAEELVREDKAELDEDLVLKQVEAEGETAQPIEKAAETEDGKEPEEEKSISLDEFRDRIYNAWRAQFPQRVQDAAIDSWIREVMDDAVIVNENGKLYRVPYVVEAETGNIQFGTPVQVQEVRQFVPVEATPSSTVVPHVATKAEIEAEDNGRRLQIIDLLDQLKGLLQEEWTVDTEIANAAALGNRGTNPPTTVERSEAEDEDEDEDDDEEGADEEEEEAGEEQEKARARALSTLAATGHSTKPTPQSVEIAAYVDNWAMQVKAALLAEGDRRDKFAALQQLINQFGEGVVALVKEGTPPSSRDVADVVSEAVRAAVEPLQNQLAGVKAELDDLREKAATLGQGAQEQAPRPQSLDFKARVIQPTQQGVLGPRTKAWTAKELAWASTREVPGY